VLGSWPRAQRVFRGGVPKSTRTVSVACRVNRVTLIAMPRPQDEPLMTHQGATLAQRLQPVRILRGSENAEA
jgi:hypothetical protein